MAVTTVSTHVLDTERGAPSAGVHVELFRPDGTLAGEGVTDDDGRIVRFLEKPTWGQVFSDTPVISSYRLR